MNGTKEWEWQRELNGIHWEELLICWIVESIDHMDCMWHLRAKSGECALKGRMKKGHHFCGFLRCIDIVTWWLGWHEKKNINDCSFKLDSAFNMNAIIPVVSRLDNMNSSINNMIRAAICIWGGQPTSYKPDPIERHNIMSCAAFWIHQSTQNMPFLMEIIGIWCASLSPTRQTRHIFVGIILDPLPYTLNRLHVKWDLPSP